MILRSEFRVTSFAVFLSRVAVSARLFYSVIHTEDFPYSSHDFCMSVPSYKQQAPCLDVSCVCDQDFLMGGCCLRAVGKRA